ncbi:MAG TPA: hypothetical protein DDX84_01565 [Nitrospiraceae bacterium]|nr:hypothetical protein [Nitrospiraceae bacterium]
MKTDKTNAHKNMKNSITCLPNRQEGFKFILAAIIILITILVYIPAIRGGFIWDDDAFLTDNPLIKASDGLYYFWFSTKPPDYFPLVSTSLWIEWRLWGMNATGYHITNVLLHAISSVLVWLVLTRLKIPGAWLAGLIFAVHPVNVESVAWITERKNTLPMVFYLLTILSYLQFEVSSKQRWYFISLSMFLLALLGKTSVVMLPFVLLGLAWWQRGRVTREDLIRSIPFFALSLMLGLVTVWFQYKGVGEDIVRNDSFLSRLAISGWAVWFYLFKALIPYKLTFVYPRWEIDEYSILSYIPLFILLLLLSLFWLYRRTWGKSLLAGFGYFVVTLIPVLGFLNIYFMKYSFVADHWQYFSIIGIIALIVGVGSAYLSRLNKITPEIRVTCAVIVVAILSLLTWKQCFIYKDMETLRLDTIRKNPTTGMAHNNLGNVYEKQGRLDEAIKEYLIALKIKPDDAEIHNNLGVVYYEQSRVDDAIKEYLTALKIKPDYGDAHYNLALVYHGQGRLNEAIKEYMVALKIKPDDAEIHNNLGLAYAIQGHLDESIHEFQITLKLKPDHANASFNLGLAYKEKERRLEAESTE